MAERMRHRGSRDRWRRDEQARILFERMLSRAPVWVDSPAGQMTWIDGFMLDGDGEILAVDAGGNNRPVTDYLLDEKKP